MSYLFTLFVFVYVQWCPTHIVLCFVLFVFVLCTLCCQYLWIVPSVFSTVYSQDSGERTRYIQSINEA